MKKFEYFGKARILFELFVPCYVDFAVSEKKREQIYSRIAMKIRVKSGPMKDVVIYVSGYDHGNRSYNAVFDNGRSLEHGFQDWECSEGSPDELDRQHLQVKVYKMKKRPKRADVIKKLKKRYDRL